MAKFAELVKDLDMKTAKILANIQDDSLRNLMKVFNRNSGQIINEINAVLDAYAENKLVPGLPYTQTGKRKALGSLSNRLTSFNTAIDDIMREIVSESQVPLKEAFSSYTEKTIEAKRALYTRLGLKMPAIDMTMINSNYLKGTLEAGYDKVVNLTGDLREAIRHQVGDVFNAGKPISQARRDLIRSGKLEPLQSISGGKRRYFSAEERARMIMQTELTQMYNLTENDLANQLKLEYIIITGGPGACKTCQDAVDLTADGIPVEHYISEIGMMPPFHPNCIHRAIRFKERWLRMAV